MTTDIMIASAAQTPVGSFNGAFATSPRTTLVPSRLRLLSIALEVTAEEVDEVILGQSPNLDAWQGPTNRHGP
jgi:acetyl-CoA C-acetyltransferase